MSPAVPVPCVAVIFSSTRAIGDDAEYEAMADEMSALARRQDGFLGMTSVRDPGTRQGVTVSYWRDEHCASEWKSVAAHLQAQRLGRERWYSEYEVVVAEVSRSYRYPSA